MESDIELDIDRRARSERRGFESRKRSKSEGGARGMDFSNLIRPPKLLNLALEAHQAKKEAKRLRDRTRDFLGNNEEMVGDAFIDSLPPHPKYLLTPHFSPGGKTA